MSESDESGRLIDPESAKLLPESLRKDFEEWLLASLNEDGDETELVRAFTADIADDPYSDKARALMDQSAVALSHLAYIGLLSVAVSGDVKHKADELTGGNIDNVIAFVSRIESDFNTVKQRQRKGELLDMEPPLILDLNDPETVSATLDVKYSYLCKLKDAGRLEQSIVNIPLLQSIIPQSHVIPNTKASNYADHALATPGGIDLVINKKRGIINDYIVTYEGDDVSITGRHRRTEYDRSVEDAITTLWQYGDPSHIVTPAMVYRAMVCNQNTDDPSPQAIAAVTRSLDKLAFMRVRIDLTDELKDRGLSLDGEQITGGKIDTYLLALEKTTISAGGKNVTAYKVLRKPILYEYAQLTGQVITIPAYLLDIKDNTGKSIANTDQRIIIRKYLIRRIERMRKDKTGKQSHHIRFSDLYEHVSDSELNRRDQKRIRDYAESCLKYWRADKWIKGYQILKQGRAFYCFDIRL